MALVLANKVMDALAEAGVISVEDRIRRVVIDLKVNEVAVIHVERIGDEKLLNVVPSMVGVEIVREERAEVAP